MRIDLFYAMRSYYLVSFHLVVLVEVVSYFHTDNLSLCHSVAWLEVALLLSFNVNGGSYSLTVSTAIYIVSSEYWLELQ